MKFSKNLIAAIILVGTTSFSTVVDAGSIGRSSGGSSSRSSSFSRPSTPAPSRQSMAPAPSRPGGIGGTTGSMGARKSEVTAPVAQKVEQKRPQPAGTTSPSPSYAGAAAPNYGGYSQPPSYNQPSGGMGGFGSSFAGALGGSVLGNMLFSNHGSGGTTVVNNGGGSGGGYATTPTVVDGSGQVISQPQMVVQQKESYGMGKLILDIILFAVLVGVVVGIIFLFYKGFRMIQSYVNKERGVKVSQPFSPTQQFWVIQRAFANADVALLQTLLGPDMVDEATQNLTPSTLTLSNVSHEIALSTPVEVSVHYTFQDSNEQAVEVNQVWHYEKFNNVWQLNGIENI